MDLVGNLLIFWFYRSSLIRKTLIPELPERSFIILHGWSERWKPALSWSILIYKSALVSRISQNLLVKLQGATNIHGDRLPHHLLHLNTHGVWDTDGGPTQNSRECNVATTGPQPGIHSSAGVWCRNFVILDLRELWTSPSTRSRCVLIHEFFMIEPSYDLSCYCPLCFPQALKTILLGPFRSSFLTRWVATVHCVPSRPLRRFS